ncbi:MAG: SusD/RagB family nutrient-binding outer membrane lipoprotein [Odoribacter sp.]|nr:SusD/RagB family nutrient-binding outer membrane lipoprotein [Odoribacter sp.]
MNKIKGIGLAILTGLALSGCNDILDDNVNIDRAHSNTADLGLPPVIFFANQVVYDHAEYGIYLSQCLTTMSKSERGDRTYKFGWGGFLTMQRHPQWRRHYYDIGVNGNELIANSRAINSPNYELIARTIMLMSTQLTTDCFGDMPREEAYLTNSPHYDTQASVYAWMFQEAEELLKMYNDPAIVNSSENREIPVSRDRIYAGDLNKWKGLVLAVKARLLLRNLPNIDRSAATCQAIIAAADEAINCWRSGDLMYGAWFGNEPRYNFDGGTYAQSAAWGPGDTRFDTWQSYANNLDQAVPSKFFMQDLLGVVNPGEELKQGKWDSKLGFGADPRLELLFQAQEGPISASNDSKMTMLRYLENNIGAAQAFKQTHYPVLYCGAYAAAGDAYNVLFTMEELYFIKAEAYYWMGDKVTACHLAKEATQWNIQRHLDRFLADNNGMYPYTNGKANPVGAEWFPLHITSFLDNVDGQSPTMRAVRTTKCEENGQKHWYFNESTFSLSDLMIQKYIAMYMQPEQWTDMRRYHFSNNRNNYGVGDAKEIVYPTLRRPYNLYAPYFVDGRSNEQQENTWIQRINYDPETEEKYNAKELERLGAAMNHEWLLKPMNWALDYGVRTSLTAE